ncbi:hypothetical protein T439DRAFT_377386 [Meredithblackwellia eburnea MCA 4105]
MPPSRKCRHCHREFIQSEHLKRHERTHDGSKPYPCTMCTKAFARSDVLARHLRRHSNPDSSASQEPLSTTTVTSPQPVLQAGISNPEAPPESSLTTTAVTTAGVLGRTSSQDLVHLEAALDINHVAPAPHEERAPTEDWTSALFGVLGHQDAGAGLDLSSFFSFLDPGDRPSTSFHLNVHADTGPALRLQDSEALFQESMRVWPSSLEHDAVPATSWGHLLPQTSVVDTIRSELEASVPLDVVEIPSSTFLLTALNYYWRHHHTIIPVIHEGTFHASEHLPLLLLAMCASGASYMGSPKAQTFATSVFNRILHVLLKRWSDDLSNTQKKDLLTVGLLTSYHGFSQGTKAWLASVVGLLGSVIANARHSGIFNSVESNIFYSSTNLAAPTTDLWRQWASVESSTRLGNAIIILDAWTHIVARDQHPPVPFGQVRLDFPCTDALFQAPTASDWLALLPGGLARPPSLSIVTRTLFSSIPIIQAPNISEWWGHQCLIMIIYCHKRCRWMSAFTEDNALQNRYDKDVITALYLWREWARPPSLGSLEFLTSSRACGDECCFHALCLDMSVDVECMALAAGRDGSQRATHAGNLLMRHWYGTPRSRRALLHACRIIRLILNDLGHPSTPLHTFAAGLYAALCFMFYSFGAELEAMKNPVPSTSLTPPFKLGEDIDINSVGLAGYEDGDWHETNLTSDALRFVVYGGPCTFDNIETIDTAYIRSNILLHLSGSLATKATVGSPYGKRVAALIAVWAQLELDVRPDESVSSL